MMELTPGSAEGTDPKTAADIPVHTSTMTLVAEITVSTDGLTAETGLRPDHLAPFVQGLVDRALAGYPDVLRVRWKPGYRMFVRTIAEFFMEGELDDAFDPPEPFVFTFDDMVETLNRLIGDARELFDS